MSRLCLQKYYIPRLIDLMEQIDYADTGVSIRKLNTEVRSVVAEMLNDLKEHGYFQSNMKRTKRPAMGEKNRILMDYLDNYFQEYRRTVRKNSHPSYLTIAEGIVEIFS